MNDKHVHAAGGQCKVCYPESPAPAPEAFVGQSAEAFVLRADCDALRTALAKDAASDKSAPPPFEKYEREGQFAKGLESLVNRYSQENGSNTPDFVLAGYLIACLRAFNEASRAREEWYGKSLHI
jgi:hypothetical protein